MLDQSVRQYFQANFFNRRHKDIRELKEKIEKVELALGEVVQESQKNQKAYSQIKAKER